MMRSTTFRHSLAILLAAIVFVLSSGMLHHASYAEGTPPNRTVEGMDGNGNRIRCADIEEAKTGVLLGYLIPCITHTIEGVTQKMTAESIDWLKPAVYSFITLAVVLFGVRILQGGGQVHSEGILLLLKIGMVIAMLELIPTTFVPLLYDVMNESQEIIAGAIGPDQSSIHCDIAKYQNGSATMVWAQLDCVAGKLYGISVGGEIGPNGEKRPNMLLGASIFGLLGGFLFGGTFGVILFLACVGVLWTMFMLILRTAVAFLNGYLYASILFIVSPLFLPLILLKGSTQYFEPWWKGILGSIMLPIIISSYAMIALLLYDKILFEQPTPGVEGSGALLYKLFDNELVKQIQGMPRPACNLERPGNIAQRSESTGISESNLYGGTNLIQRNFAMPLLNYATDQCFGMRVPTLDMTAGLDTDSNRKAFTDLFYDCVKLLVLAVMINMGFTSVTGLARKLIGSGGVASSMDPQPGMETKLAAISTSTKESFKRAFNRRDEEGRDTGVTTSGAEFISRLPHVPQEIGKGILTGLGR